MKTRFILLFLVALALAWYLGNRKSPSSGELVYALSYPLENTMISGHRGAKAYPDYPENCLETFDYLRSKINCIIECDIAQTKDGVLVLMHDEAIDRTTNGSGRIDQLKFSELQDLHLLDAQGKPSNYRIPTFEDVLAWAKETKTILSVDIKRSVPFQSVVDEIREKKAEANCMLISYSLKQSKKMYQYAPEFMQSIAIRDDKEFERWQQAGIPAERTIAFTGTIRSPKKIYDKLHAEGIACIFGTLGNIDREAAAKGDKVYLNLKKDGVDIFATDRPLEVNLVVRTKN